MGSDLGGREEGGLHCPYETPQSLRLKRCVTMRSLCFRPGLNNACDLAECHRCSVPVCGSIAGALASQNHHLPNRIATGKPDG